MGRRGQECRCCAGCSDCETTPTVIKAHIVYPDPEGGSEIIQAGKLDPIPIGFANPPGWTSVTTTCTALPSEVGLRVFITDPGDGYTSPPVMSVAGGGGTVGSQLITIESAVESITVTKGGANYSTAPTVEFSVPSGGGRITAATAEARVEGKVSTLTLTNSGVGYSVPPTVTFATGTGATASVVMNGYVSALQLTAPGSEYTSAPSVTISGGGGSGATATAKISGNDPQPVQSLVLTNKGSGYTSPPAVTITGGGGKDAVATASLLFTVQSISLVAGGSGYPPNPEVTLAGGGGSGATATAKISGSVVGVDVLNAGLYRNSNTGEGSSSFPNWPTISFSGGGGSGAAAVPVFSGKLVGVSTEFSEGFASRPTITFSGGGGSGATADAELTWERDHTRRALFGVTDCRSAINDDSHCLDVAASVLPFTPVLSCPGVNEVLRWSVNAVTDADQAEFDLTSFAGEAVRAIVTRQWSVPGQAEKPPFATSEILRRVTTYYVQRFFSRIEPAVVFRLRFPPQAAENNVTLTPTVRQYADPSGEPYWYIESLAITHAGSNLKIPPGTVNCTLEAVGNSRHVIGSVPFTVARSIPVVTVPVLDGWSVQPVIAVTIAPSGSGGFYFVSGVAVTSGGETNQEDGTFLIDLALTAGHFDGNAVRLTGTISGGTLASVVIFSSSLIIGPSTLATIEQPELGFPHPNRSLTGESPYKTTRTHTKPTVTATQVVTTDEGEVVVTLGVTLAEDTDLNGETYWYVAGLTGSVPAGNTGNALFEVESPGIEASPAIGSASYDTVNDVQLKLIASGGKYFIRQTTETSELLPPISCIGELNEANGWEIREQEEISTLRAFYVGETFLNTYQHIPGPGQPSIYPEVTRTRRCGLPTITLELE